MSVSAAPLLRAKSVTRRFGGLVAVNGVDYEIPKGSISAIIGPNGAGKTTFFNVIAGIYAPSDGTIELDGKSLVRPPKGEERELFILVGAPYVERLRGDVRLNAALAAVTAAVVGVILNLALFFAVHVVWPQGMGGPLDAMALLLTLASGLALIRFRRGVLEVVGAYPVQGIQLDDHFSLPSSFGYDQIGRAHV